MFGRGVLDKTTLIRRLESMSLRHEEFSDTFGFETYLGLTFASDDLVDSLALLVRNNDQVAFSEKMYLYQDRFRKAPNQIRKSLRWYLGRRCCRLQSFDDLQEVLKRLKG